ncbi:DUF551 domain-containing protein [Cupriavidus necator]
MSDQNETQVLDRQIVAWTRERDRLNGMIAHVTGGGQQPQSESTWIPVVDRLPEHETDVLVRGVLHCGRMFDIAGLFHGKWMSHVTQDDCKFEVTDWRPLDAAPPQAAPVAQGLTDAAAFIERKAEEYAREFGYSDMGCLSFGSGDHAQAKMDHYTTLTELADEVRALAQPDSGPLINEGTKTGPVTEPLQGTQTVAMTALERDMDQVMKERDDYHEIADKLANGVAEHFDIDIGEHSNLNCPWSNALDALDSAICAHGIAAAAPTQGTQEPVAWRHSHTLCLYETREDVPLADGDEWAVPLYLAAPAPSASPAALTVPKGFAIKRVEGHGWIIDASDSSWIAHEGTPIGDFIGALLAASPAPYEASHHSTECIDGECPGCIASPADQVGDAHRFVVLTESMLAYGHGDPMTAQQLRLQKALQMVSEQRLTLDDVRGIVDAAMSATPPAGER